MRRCVLHSTAACFAISLRGNCFRWERCFHAGGAVVQFCRQFIVCWPQCSSTGLFCGLRYNPIRIQRLFLPTFSGKTEKVGLRSNSSSPVQTGKWPDIRPAILPILRCAGRRRLPAGPPSRGGPAGARECAAGAEPPPCGRRPTKPVRRRSAPAPAPPPTRRHSF